MKNNLLFKILIVILVLGSLGTAGFFYWRYQIVSGAAEVRENKALINKISTIMVLPDENPTIATVTDKTKLSSQKFFKNADNGDKVLIFPLASKAILYRPSQNKIIEVASVTTGPDSSASVSPTPLANVNGPASVAIYNGTTVSGLAAKIEKALKNSNVTIAAKATAAKSDYQQTVVIALNPQMADRATQIATTLKAKTLPGLPAGEANPGSDILVIIGMDKQ